MSSSPLRERVVRKRLKFDIYSQSENIDVGETEADEGSLVVECHESPLKFHALNFASNPPSPTTVVDEDEIENDPNEEILFESEPFSHISESQVEGLDPSSGEMNSPILFETPPRLRKQPRIFTTPLRIANPVPVFEHNTEFISEFVTPKKEENFEEQKDTDEGETVEESERESQVKSNNEQTSQRSQGKSEEPEIYLSASTVSNSSPKISNGLVDQMKTFLTSHQNSIKMFPVNIKKGIVDREGSILFRICHICELMDGFLLTICLNESTNEDIWVLFKPDTLLEIGASLTLFPPWLKVHIDILGEEVIYSTEFSKMSEEEPSQEWEIPSFPQKMEKLKEAEEAEDGIFAYIVPYWIRNENTARKQARAEKEEIDLDVVICQGIEGEDGKFEVLVKDSDNFCSLIQIPSDGASDNEESKSQMAPSAHHFHQLSTLSRAEFVPGKLFHFRNLGFSGKVTLKMWLPVFAVFSAYGCQQRFHYSLVYLDGISSYEIPSIKSPIPFVPSDGSKQMSVLEISNALKVQTSLDTRVWLIGRILKMDSNKIYLADEGGEILRVIYSSFFSIEKYRNFIQSKEHVRISMLRIFRGIVSVDKYSWITRCLPEKDAQVEQNDC